MGVRVGVSVRVSVGKWARVRVSVGKWARVRVSVGKWARVRVSVLIKLYTYTQLQY